MIVCFYGGMMNYPSAEKAYHHTSHLTYSCQYHVVFCPKYRRKVLSPPVDEGVKEVFLRIAEEKDFRILDMEVMPDHVHLLLDVNPRYGVSQAVKDLKGRSSKVLRDRYPSLKSRIPTLWTRSSFISSVGAVSLAVVQQYIENQKNV